MAQKESTSTPKEPKKTAEAKKPEAEKPAAPAGPASAPELPSTVAHQYGLHSYRSPGRTSEEPTALAEDGIVEDDKTKAAVDDIVAKESDTVLEAEDARFAPPAEPKKRGFWRTLGRPFAFWWRHKWLRWLTVLLLFAAIGAVAAIPKARYAVLNKVGVRSSASVTVLDQTTQLPLKNVQVSVGGIKTTTNKDGVATLREVPLGPSTLTIKRIAFAPITKDVTIGWGSNPLGSFSMTATGTQYTIKVTDYLSGQPLAGAEASSGADINALADKQGKITLTVSDTEVTELDVQVGLSGYRTEALKLQADQTTEVQVILVPAQKSVFVSRASGKYDLYTMDLDGKNRKVVLPGTGSEGPNISLAVNAAGDRAALVSTRDMVRDSDGYLLGTLTLVDLTTGAATALEHAAQIQLVDWIGNRLVYRMGQPGASASDNQRYRLMSYDHQTKSRMQLASANEFNGIVSAGGILYYAVSGTDPSAQPGLFKIKPDGTGKIHLFQQEVWSTLRSSYNTIMLQTPNNWFSYTLGSLQPTPASQPSSFSGQAYIENGTFERSLWIDERDGKGTLLVHDNKANNDTVAHQQDGLAYPVRWLNGSVAIYRVATAGETADYAKSLWGGDAKKLTDVTNTFGHTR